MSALRKLVAAFVFTLLPLLPASALGADASGWDDELFSLEPGTPAEESAAAEASPFSGSAEFDAAAGIASFHISMREGAYIYKDALFFEGEGGVKFESLPLPDPVMHEIPGGNGEVYMNAADLKVRILSAADGSRLTLTYQGCDAQGICYPPQTLTLELAEVASAASADALTEQMHAEQNASGAPQFSSSFAVTLLIFVLMGMGLDLTPCVLPLLGIFSAMIMGSAKQPFLKALRFNLIYLAGLTLTYTALGWIFASLGMRAHAYLQSPAAVIVMTAIFTVMALDCAGIITIRVPKAFNGIIEKRLSSQRRGTALSALCFGLLSGLMTTPCTSAPLAGALLYIAGNGSVLEGTLLFMAIGLGMGIPLLLVGLCGGRFLPKPGSISAYVRRLIAVPLLFAAAVTLMPLFDFSPAFKVGCAAVIMGYFVWITMLQLGIEDRLIRAASSLLYAAAATFVVWMNVNAVSPLPFDELRTMDELSADEDLYVSFSASWCSNCHVMDDETYASDEFKDTLDAAGLRAVRFDLSDPQDPKVKRITERFRLSGVPAAVILRQGEVQSRLDGYQRREDVLRFVGEDAAD